MTSPTKADMGQTSPVDVAKDQALPRLPAWVPPAASDLNDMADASRVKQEVAAPTVPLPVVYGRDRLSGTIAVVHVDDTNGYLYVLFSFAEPSTAIDKLFIDNIDVDDTTDGLLIKGGAVELFPAGGSVSTLLAGVIPGYADAPQACNAVVKIPKAYSRSFPKVEAIIRGRAVYDPRSDTTAYSTNPALCFADMAAQSGWDVLWSSVTEAANFADEVVGGAPRREIGLTLASPRPAEEWAKVFRVYTGCFIVWEDGKIRMIPDKAVTVPDDVTKTLTVDDILADSVRLKRRNPMSFPTTVIVEYRDASDDDNWRTERAVYEQPGITAARVSRVSLPGIHSYAQAYREAKERQLKFVADLSLELTLFDDALELQIGAVVKVTHPIGVDGYFRVMSLGHEQGRWRVALMEYSATAYSDDAPAPPSGYVPETGTPESSIDYGSTILIPGGGTSPSYVPNPEDFPVDWDRSVMWQVKVEGGGVVEKRGLYPITVVDEPTPYFSLDTSNQKFGVSCLSRDSTATTGNKSYIRISRAADSDLIPLSLRHDSGYRELKFYEPWTFEGWFYPTDISQSRGLLVIQTRHVPSNTEFGNFTLYIEGTTGWVNFKLDPLYTRNHLSINSGTAAWTGSIGLNAWHHIAVTRDKYGQIRVFVDGQMGTRILSAESQMWLGYVGTNWHLLGAGNAGWGEADFVGKFQEAQFLVGCKYTEDFEPPDATFTSTDYNVVPVTQLNTGNLENEIDNKFVLKTRSPILFLDRSLEELKNYNFPITDPDLSPALWGWGGASDAFAPLSGSEPLKRSWSGWDVYGVLEDWFGTTFHFCYWKPGAQFENNALGFVNIAAINPGASFKKGDAIAQTPYVDDSLDHNIENFGFTIHDQHAMGPDQSRTVYLTTLNPRVADRPEHLIFDGPAMATGYTPYEVFARYNTRVWSLMWPAAAVGQTMMQGTLEGWFWFEDYDGNGPTGGWRRYHVFSNEGGTGGNQGNFYLFKWDDDIAFGVQKAGYTDWAKASLAGKYQQWVHICVMRDMNGVITIYVDGDPGYQTITYTGKIPPDNYNDIYVLFGKTGDARYVSCLPNFKVDELRFIAGHNIYSIEGFVPPGVEYELPKPTMTLAPYLNTARSANSTNHQRWYEGTYLHLDDDEVLINDGDAVFNNLNFIANWGGIFFWAADGGETLEDFGEIFKAGLWTNSFSRYWNYGKQMFSLTCTAEYDLTQSYVPKMSTSAYSGNGHNPNNTLLSMWLDDYPDPWGWWTSYSKACYEFREDGIYWNSETDPELPPAWVKLAVTATAGYVEENRLISTGDGLTGGGDLSANRTLSLNVSGLTAETAPDPEADYAVVYDNSASAHRKMLLRDLPGARTLINNQSGTSYQLALADATKYVRFSNSGTITVTVPDNATVPFPVGTLISLRQVGDGQVQLSASGGVTINSAASLNLRKSGSSATLVKVGTDEWDLTGDLAP